MGFVGVLMPAEKVRVLTPKELDQMPPGQRQFFNDLVAKGQAKIVDPDAKHERPDRKPRGSRPLDDLMGKKCKVTLTTNDILEGTIVGISMFEIVLLTNDGAVVILKHGIIMLREVRV